MNKCTTLLIIFMGTVFSCENESINNNDEFLAFVESEKDISCGLPVVRLLDKLDRVQIITGAKGSSFNAYLLDNKFKVVGTELIIRFKKTDDKDLRACNTLGLMYPCITILDARLKN